MKSDIIQYSFFWLISIKPMSDINIRLHICFCLFAFFTVKNDINVELDLHGTFQKVLDIETNIHGHILASLITRQ